MDTDGLIVLEALVVIGTQKMSSQHYWAGSFESLFFCLQLVSSFSTPAISVEHTAEFATTSDSSRTFQGRPRKQASASLVR